MTAVTMARDVDPAALERLRGSAHATLRARQWLIRWPTTSPAAWHSDAGTVVIANAIELSALTGFVAITRNREPADG